MFKYFVAGLVVAASVMIGSASAQQVPSGRDLVRQYISEKQSEAVNFTLGVVRGAQAHSYYSGKQAFCPPKDMNVGEMVHNIIVEIADNRDIYSLSDGAAVYTAFTRLYACE